MNIVQEALDSGRAALFWKGRVALYAILRAIGVGPGDEVVVPGFTCVVVPQAVRFAGARPVYVDIDPRTLNLDPARLEDRLTSRTRAIIAQHTFGVPADIDAVRRAAPARDIRIIEDCAHTMESLYKGQRVGSLGEAAFFSTQWSKPVTTGLGGVAVSGDPEIAANLLSAARDYAPASLRARSMLWLELRLHQSFFRSSRYWVGRRSLRALARLGILVGSSSGDELVGGQPPDYTRRMARFQVRALRKAITGIAAGSDRRRRLARHYDALVRSLDLQTVTPGPQTEAVLVRYPLFVRDKPRVMDEARRRRLEIGEWFVSPLHPVRDRLERLGYRPGECPEAEAAARRIINLPLHPGVDDGALERIAGFVQSLKRDGLA